MGFVRCVCGPTPKGDVCFAECSCFVLSDIIYLLEQMREYGQPFDLSLGMCA